MDERRVFSRRTDCILRHTKYPRQCLTSNHQQRRASLLSVLTRAPLIKQSVRPLEAFLLLMYSLYVGQVGHYDHIKCGPFDVCRTMVPGKSTQRGAATIVCPSQGLPMTKYMYEPPLNISYHTLYWYTSYGTIRGVV